MKKKIHGLKILRKGPFKQILEGIDFSEDNLVAVSTHPQELAIFIGVAVFPQITSFLS